MLLTNAQRYPSDDRGLCLCKYCKDRGCHTTETSGSFALINGNRCDDPRYGCTQINCAKQFPTQCTLPSDEGNAVTVCGPMFFYYFIFCFCLILSIYNKLFFVCLKTNYSL